MQNKPTDELDNLLENMKPEDIDTYLKENDEHLADFPSRFGSGIDGKRCCLCRGKW